MKNLRIYYSCNQYPNYYLDCICTEWTEANYQVSISAIMTSTQRNTLYANVVPGAIRELTNILGTPYYIDTTYSSGNTLILSPIDGTGLADLRESRTIGVKSISDSPLKGPSGKLLVKIDGIRLLKL